MTTNFGIDLYEQDGDLIIGVNGDLFCTDDVELILNQDIQTQVRFEGYVCLFESIKRILPISFGEYSPYYVEIGAGANKTISSNTELDKEFNQFKERATTQILKDERVAEVINIEYQKVNSDEIKILMNLRVVDIATPISFVFPFNL